MVQDLAYRAVMGDFERQHADISRIYGCAGGCGVRAYIAENRYQFRLMRRKLVADYVYLAIGITAGDNAPKRTVFGISLRGFLIRRR